MIIAVFVADHLNLEPVPKRKTWIMNVKWTECKANNAAGQIIKISFFRWVVDLVLRGVSDRCLELASEI